MSYPVSFAALAALAFASVASSQTEGSDEPIVVTGVRPPIIVKGVPKCPRLPNDPLDQIDLSKAPYGVQMMIARDPATGKFALANDNDPIGGSDWQRAGTAMKDFNFRVPTNGDPLCIGSRRQSTHGFGQLRQIVDATPFRGKGVRFSGYMASKRGADIRMWLAAGLERRGVIAGDTTTTRAVKEKSGWTPFAIEIPFVPKNAWSISYGFLLFNSGDVWVFDPKLKAIPARGKDRGLKVRR